MPPVCEQCNHRRPNDYAIVIGINEYSEGLRKLDAAEADAVKFAAWLEAPEGGGLCPCHIRLIRRPPPVQDDVDNALADFGVGEQGIVGDRLYFYFAGHGLGTSFNNVAMLMANARGKLLNRNIGLNGYREYFREAGPFRETIFFLDCCRDRVELVTPREPGITNRPADGYPPKQTQDFVLMGARYSAKSFEPIESKSGEHRGLLTQALIEGLKERLALDTGVGAVTADQLLKYVKQRVPELATEAELKQVPDASPPVTLMVFGPVAPPPSYTLAVTLANPAADDVVLKDGGFKELARYPSPSFPQNIVLPAPGIYFLSHGAAEVQIDTRVIKEQPHACRIG